VFATFNIPLRLIRSGRHAALILTHVFTALRPINGGWNWSSFDC